MAFTFSRRDVLQRAKGLALATPFLGLVACDGEDDWSETTRLAGPTMGTTYRIRISGHSHKLDRRTLKTGVERILETVNRQMSNWRVDSEVSNFNAGAPRAWADISHDTLRVVEEAARIHRLSDGAFDPTIGPLVDLWGFGPASAGRRIPARSRIAAALRRTGIRHIRTRTSPPAVAKRRAGIEIDLSGIAKGFGVDRLATFLDRQGIEHYLVEIGGELRARGHSAWGRPWRIGIEAPVAGRRAVQRIVGLDGGAIATSGNYRNFFDSDGIRYSHIIDPRTGDPVDHALASVTVIAPSTMQADALSTALMVMGSDEGLRLARQEDLAALFIVREGKHFVETASPRFTHYRTG